MKTKVNPLEKKIRELLAVVEASPCTCTFSYGGLTQRCERCRTLLANGIWP